MADYINDRWQGILQHSGLAGFDALWNLNAEWFEPLNRDRGGWSGVVRLELQGSDGRKEGFFLKRQENHVRRTFRHPLGEPTFAVEFRNILLLTDAGVPTLEVVYYGQRRVEAGWRATLVTRELDGYLPLDKLTNNWLQTGWSHSMAKRRELIPVVADVVRRLHNAGLVHHALYPKHIFVHSPEIGRPQVRLIDLEKTRRVLMPKRDLWRELDSLNRRTRHWPRTDRMRFFLHYLGKKRLSPAEKKLWRQLAESKNRFARKHAESV